MNGILPVNTNDPRYQGEILREEIRRRLGDLSRDLAQKAEGINALFRADKQGGTRFLHTVPETYASRSARRNCERVICDIGTSS